MSEAKRVGVIGASGFTGALAAELVWRHPRLELAAATARAEVGAPLSDLYPRYRVPVTLSEYDPGEAAGWDAAIVAYPHGAAAPVVAELAGRGVPVVDLSADFRIREHAVYAHWYGDHPAFELVAEAAYGLTELNREAVAAARIVANPGCYPTATILALAPLAAEGLVDEVIVDAKSGVSGAGRGGGDRLHFVNVDENLSPYGTAGHRHEPEIAQELAALGGSPLVTFVPHLVPLDQGELVSCYVRPSRDDRGRRPARPVRGPLRRRAFRRGRRRPARRPRRARHQLLPHPRRRGQPRPPLVFSAIDNLWKGASGQAIQNLNLMLGLPETAGLL